MSPVHQASSFVSPRDQSRYGYYEHVRNGDKPVWDEDMRCRRAPEHGGRRRRTAVPTRAAATSAVDTEFTAKLAEVEPSGYCLNVPEGIVRARYRHGDGCDELVEPGYPYEFVIPLHYLAHAFRRGHRIRLEVSSSNFPRFARNLKSSIHPNHAGASDAEVAVQVIYHDPARASRLTLPVVLREPTTESSRQP